jgi:hypothetical protein
MAQAEFASVKHSHQQDLSEQNRRHTIEIQERLTQMEVQRQQYDAAIKQLNQQFEADRAES